MAQNRLVSNPKTVDYKVVIVGGSTGSIDVLLSLLPALQSPLSFALVIVIHRKNTADSTLANLLAYKTRVPLKEIEDKDQLLPGMIYLAPADYHLLFEQDYTFSLDDSEKVNYSRPSIDVAFESAADAFGASVTGIILSGANADGTEGARAIKKAGGVVAVQQPESAQVAFMPQQAMDHVSVDYVLDLASLVQFVNTLNRPVR